MKIRTIYNRVDRVVYEFDEDDIRSALMAKTSLFDKSGKRVEFQIGEDDRGNITATIAFVWDTPIQDDSAPGPGHCHQ